MLDARDQARIVEARELAVSPAGSELVIHGFVFPVGDPHTLRRLVRRAAHDGHRATRTPTRAPTSWRRWARPLVACERGIITEMGTDVARRHQALAQGRERHVLLLRPPQRCSPRAWPTGTLVEAGAA